jgi:subtilisin family serine protease
MKLIVKDFLNVRVGAPSVNAPSYQYLAPGSEVEVDGRLYDGDEFERVSTWYKDAADNYYWSGGFAQTKVVVPRDFDPAKMSWGHERYNIPLLWNTLKTTGEKITVAVIDTGIDKLHPDLASKIHPLSKSFVGDVKDINDTDPEGHGTSMAGIIGASGKSKVFGVAPGAELLILRVSRESQGGEVKHYAEALKYAAGIDAVDIISFSNNMGDNAGLREAIKVCIDRKKIVVASIGNGRNPLIPNGPDGDTFPACYENVMTVGAFDRAGNICSFSSWHPQLDFLAPGDASVLTTTRNAGSGPGGGTSIATAFAAGGLALLFAYAKAKKISRDTCIEAFLTSCDDIGPTVGPDIRSGRGLLNLRNAFAKL